MPNSNVSEDLSEAFAEQVREAARRHTSLRIRGGGTKAFLGRRIMGRTLETGRHRGVVFYEPSELVITVRAGTPLAKVETLLAKNRQMLAFEPPALGPASTIGGVVAAGLAGPRRPFSGAVRDSILGVTVLDGRGHKLRFGGQVFKNVAGFDAFRLMAGAMGTLGLILDVSLRVAPLPRAERHLAFEEPWARSAKRLADLRRQPSPLSGAFHDGRRLHLRLSGAEGAVTAAAKALGGERGLAKAWTDMRNMQAPVFNAARVWRLSLPEGAPELPLEGECVIGWAGAQRWLASDSPADQVREVVQAAGGHATLFRGVIDGDEVFEPLPKALLALHRRLKAALDPAAVFNRGLLYEGL